MVTDATGTERLFVRHGRLHFFVREALKRLRLPGPHASQVGDALVAADLAGVEGEGVRRLPHFASAISAGVIAPEGRMRVVEENQATAIIDGENAMGHVVATKGIELAMELAKRHGVGAVTARRSNDFGMAGFYARMALREQMIGIACSNATVAMVPTYGTKPMLGSNPIAIAVPAEEGEAPFVLDMATTATSRAQIEDAVRRREAIPNGVALDAQGKPTNDPRAALDALRLLPLGGSAETSSHKGYGLALAVDILSGVLSGGSFGEELAVSEAGKASASGIGHFFLAIRIRSFTPWVRFRNRIKDMLDRLTRSPAQGAPRVYYPGEEEFALEQERRASGIPIDPDVAAELSGLARRLDIYDTWEHLVEGKK
jgi:LDH2 family malate/lactate/ureidoglycolate dehydrogenase